MQNIADTLTAAAEALVAANQDRQSRTLRDFDNTLRSTFGPVAKSNDPNYNAAVLHLITEQAKIAPDHALENLMTFSNNVAGDQNALEETLTAITTDHHMEAYLKTDRTIEKHIRESKIGKKFLNESLGLNAPVTPASANRVLKGISVILKDVSVNDSLDTHTRTLMEIVREDDYSLAQKREVLILMNDRKIQPHLESITPGFIAQHATPAAISAFSDPKLTLESTRKQFELFVSFLDSKSPLTPCALAAYPALRDASLQKIQHTHTPADAIQEQHKFLKNMMHNPHHYIADLYRQIFKDIEARVLPETLQHPDHPTLYTYEETKADFGMQMLQFGDDEYLEWTKVQKTKGNWPSRPEGDKAVTEAIEFAYQHRPHNLAQHIGDEIISTYMRQMESATMMTGVRLDSLQLPPLEAWAAKRLNITSAADIEKIVTDLNKDNENLLEKLVPDHMFLHTRDIAVRALYNEMLKHVPGDENTSLRLRTGAAIADFLNTDEITALRQLFKDETAKDTNAVWPSFKQMVTRYTKHRSGRNADQDALGTLIAIVNDYLETGLNGLNTANQKEARKLMPYLTEDVSQDFDYETRIPLRKGIFTHIDKFQKSSTSADISGVMGVRL